MLSIQIGRLLVLQAHLEISITSLNISSHGSSGSFAMGFTLLDASSIGGEGMRGGVASSCVGDGDPSDRPESDKSGVGEYEWTAGCFALSGDSDGTGTAAEFRPKCSNLLCLLRESTLENLRSQRVSESTSLSIEQNAPPATVRTATVLADTVSINIAIGCH